MSPTERKLAKRVIDRSRRVLEKRRQLDLAEKELKRAVEALEVLTKDAPQPAVSA